MIEALLGSVVDEFGLYTIIGIGFVVLVTSAIHGATGVAGGFLMSAAIAPLIGVKPIVPVISVALLISHSARALMNMRDFDRSVYFSVAVPAIPCIVAGALIYGRLQPTAIAILLGCVILSSIPIRRWAKSREIKAGKPTLYAAGAVYGGLSGTSIGPGMLLIPFMLGYGLRKEAFVATLAVIALTTNVTRVSVFGGLELLDARYLTLGVLIGLVTIPGNWIGRSILRRMTNEGHGTLVDILTVIGALNFFWLAYRA
ncbi:sulfite exporter TauE/SafE family protein [Pelagibius sp. Alg239-R121]|uniref:sulfite exporter TauE/SafE family protein n=1 Tax=Pelagibius sp. Alg239-R121 TaxID=2993448 RepID=UPI0024A66CB6|nr:sulfite exporter TauE/SafE family protein [Pelagibius sp. Alg239-R121]